MTSKEQELLAKLILITPQFHGLTVKAMRKDTEKEHIHIFLSILQQYLVLNVVYLK
ncbi:hypothetical protein [Psychromonas sp. GE-S-Ul-11]|uniref:hypothetical protein n=1 Tax=unclassified Psychromonas TaxID=2614957 RepID=UPI00390CBC07